MHFPQTEADFNLWLEHLTGGELFQKGFERLTPFLTPLKAMVQQKTVVTIAGTNGKGEVAHRLAHICQQERKNYALWTSPHISSIRERFEVNGELIELTELLALSKALYQESRAQNISLSYYEFLLVVFLRFVLRQDVELVIFEVGLGGRLDGVNFFDADVSCMTSISRDHTAYLGETYRAIFHEKWDVSRPGKKMITSLELAYLRQLAQAQAQKQGVVWEDLFEQKHLTQEDSFSQRNTVMAQQLYFELSGHQVVAPKRSLKGRGEVVEWGKSRFFFFGGHNLDGMRKLLQFLSQNDYNFLNQHSLDTLLFAFSVRPEKEKKAMLKLLLLLAPYIKELFTAEFEHHKAAELKAEELPASVHKLTDLKGWLEGLRTQKRHILVTGSYYFVGFIQEHLFSH